MRAAILVCVLAASLQAAIDGTVINATTGKPQAGASLSLIGLGGTGGMNALASAKSDAQGQFRIDQAPQESALLQAVHQGVTYNLMLSPGAPTSGLKLEIYDSTAQPGAAKIIHDVVLLEPAEVQLSVRESVIFQNDGKLTFNDRTRGTLRVFVPEGAQDALRVSATSPNGMPLEQRAVPTGERGVFKVDFPIKPGQTSFEVSYTVPFTSPGSFSGRVLHKEAPVRLVVPSGVSLKGEGLELLGQEPQSQASIYGVNTPEYRVEIQGMGAMAAAAPEPAQGGTEDQGSGFDQILPRVYGSLYPILGLAFAILALGFAMLYRKNTNERG